MATAFAKAFINKAKKNFSEAKKFKHREGNNFGPADVPDGTFTAVVTAEMSVPTKGTMEGVPIVRFKATINGGTHEGKEPSQTFFCQGKPIPTDPDEFPTAEQQLLGLVSWLLPDMQIDEVEQVPDALDLINQRGPICIIGVSNKEEKNATGALKKYQNVYFNKLVKPASFQSAEDNNSGSANTTASDDSNDDSGNDYIPAKDDIVTVLEKDGEWNILQVSQARKTANLSDENGTRLNGVAWGDLTLL